jgi:hypothetical protein
MNYHRWIEAGREWDAPIVNLWRCEHCGVFKALSEPGSTGRRIIEYSSADGEVLSRRGAGPPCERGQE